MVLQGCLLIFSVLKLKTEERVWVSQKHKLLLKQLDSLAVSWKKIQHLCPWKSKFVLIYQPDLSSAKPAKR